MTITNETESQTPSATKQIFLTVPIGLGLEDLQVDDLTKDLWAHLTELGITPDEYQAVRSMKVLTASKARYLDSFRRAINQIRAVTPYLVLPTPPSSGCAIANKALEYRWEPESEEDRLKKIEQLYAGFACQGTLELDVIDHPVTALTTWQTDLIISPVDALMWLGIDPQLFLTEKPDERKLQQAIERYCDCARHLSQVPNLKLGDYYQGCIKKDGAKPHEDCLTGWLRLPTKQTAGGALTVRRMPINPATWFQVDEKVYSIAPMYIPAIVNEIPEGNKVKQAAVGDLITVATFLHTNPFIVQQVAIGKTPRIDIAGTRLRGGGDWTASCPSVHYDGSRAWLSADWSSDARGGCGSFVCAWE